VLGKKDFPTSARRAFEDQDDDGDRAISPHPVWRAIAVAAATILVTGLIVAWMILGSR
jgi:hypothetical protein